MKVSIGLPVYNNAPTLMKTLRSIFAQTLQDWELIVVDDGSKDGSLDLLDLIDDPRVRVFSDGLNRGLAARLNQIASMARCDLVARMDADDMMHPQRLQRQVEFLAEHPEVDFVGTAIYSIDNNDQVQGIRSDRALDVDPSKVLTRALSIVHPTVMGRKEWFLNNPYDEQLRRAQDRELWYRTMPHTAAAILTTPLLFYREHEVNFEEYNRHLAANRVILARHGPSLLGRAGTAVQWLRSHLKGWTCRVACLLGGGRYLIRRRNRKTLPEEYAVAANCLKTIFATDIPGFSPSRPGSQAA